MAERCAVIGIGQTKHDVKRTDVSLPGLLREAIQTAKASGNTAFFLRATRPFWEDDGLPASLWSDTIFERVLVSQIAEAGEYRIRVWINGDNALRVDRLGAQAGPALIETLARVRPSTKGELEIIGHFSWGSDPYTGGEKYVLGPGDVTRFGKMMSRNVGPIFWAGEHHKSRDQGVEAALASGERAARELQEDFGVAVYRVRTDFGKLCFTAAVLGSIR